MYLLARLYSYAKSCLISILTNIILTKLARINMYMKAEYQKSTCKEVIRTQKRKGGERQPYKFK